MTTRGAIGLALALCICAALVLPADAAAKVPASDPTSSEISLIEEIDIGAGDPASEGMGGIEEKIEVKAAPKAEATEKKPIKAEKKAKAAAAPEKRAAPKAKSADRGKESPPEEEAAGDRTRCKITFKMKGWSAFYRKADGRGQIECDNGQSAEVTLAARGGGITFGKQEIDDGHGSFTKVEDISEVFGSYTMSEAHAGAKKSANAQALTKGKVSLAFSGTGRGYDLGFSFGRLKIAPIKEREKVKGVKQAKRR